jgi:hypothetical protein
MSAALDRLPAMPKRLLSLLLALAACALSAASASAASPDAWTVTGQTAAITYDGTRGDAVMRYAQDGRSGTWTMQTTAAAARKLSATWNYQGYHAWFGVEVAIEKFVIRNGTEIVTEPLHSAGAARCCEAPSGGFEYSGNTHFDVQAGDVYGFRMRGKNADSDARLHGTLTLDVLDYTQLKITPKVTGSLGANGWYTSDVTVAFQITYPPNYPLLSACLPKQVRTDTAGETFSCRVRLPGGRELRESVTIKRDTTPPVVTITGPDAINAGTLRSHGFYVSTYEIKVADALSGLLPSYGSVVPHCTATRPDGKRFTVSHVTSVIGDGNVGTGTCMTYDAAGNSALTPITVTT